MIYFLSKFVTHFLLPPGLFIMLALAGSLFFKRHRTLLISFGALIWVFSTEFTASLLLYPLEDKYREHGRLDEVGYVVVLGGGITENTPDFSLSSGAFKRALLGYTKAKELNIPLIYTGGGSKNISEADSFYKDLQTLFAKPPNTKKNLLDKGFYTVLEGESLDTYENAKFTQRIFEESNVKEPKIALVTSAFHQRRAGIIFEKFGFEVTPLACDFQSDGIECELRDFLPSISGLTGSFIALKEYVGILSLKLR